MQPRKIIYCTVTNDLNQDQRMHRICGALVTLGYEVILVGRQKKRSLELFEFGFEQRRLKCFFEKGFLFYGEYNIRLFLYLLLKKIDVVYSVDLDTISAGGMMKLLRRKKLVFDAHEYYEETPELYKRAGTKRFWSMLGRLFVPLADRYITVNESLSKILGQLYSRNFTYVYNAPNQIDTSVIEKQNVDRSYIIYQGVLNEGRGISEMIGAMKYIVGLDFYIVGDGDLTDSLKQQVVCENMQEKVKFLGWLSPSEMKNITIGATLGLNLLDGSCKNYYYSLANKFFDYMHVGIPSVNMDFPEYRNIIEQFKVGILIKELSEKVIAKEINDLLNDKNKVMAMRENCFEARQYFNWQNEVKKIEQIFKTLSE